MTITPVTNEYNDLLEMMRLKKRTHKAASNLLMVQALEALETVIDQNRKLAKELSTCRNELCLKCGGYQREYFGACDSCRWRKE